MRSGPSRSIRLGWQLAVLLAFFFSTAALRADLVLEQQSSDTNGTQTVILKLHGDKMRMDQPSNSVSVIVDLKTRDSLTLLNKDKTFLRKFGSEVRWEMSEELKYTHGTNDLDFPPAPAVDTGKSGTVNGRDARIYTWSGASGITETLWVATDFPNFDGIRKELLKVDAFNDSGPHRNAQPQVGRLPGMVIKSETMLLGHKLTTTLVSVKLEPVDPAVFERPADYSPWKRPPGKKP